MLSSATGTNIINVLISELYIVSRNCLDLLSLVPYGVQTAEKWTKRGNVVTPPTDKPDVWVWSAELLLTLWFETSLAFGCLCIFHFLSSSWPRLQPRYCPWDVCFGWTFWTHLVLNAVVKSRAVAAVCGFLNLVSIYFCIHGRSGWRRGGEAGLSTCESLSVTSQQKQNQIFAWSKLKLWGLRGHVNLSSAVSCYKYTDTITSVSL